jgi:hypothetical protein
MSTSRRNSWRACRFGLSALLILGLSAAVASDFERPLPFEHRYMEGRCWILARQLAGAPTTWRDRPRVVWEPGNFPFLDEAGELKLFLGYYAYYPTVDTRGRIKVEERIYIFLLEEEMDHALEEVLTHEYLHAFYLRLKATNPALEAAHPSAHSWIRTVYDRHDAENEVRKDLRFD